MKKLSAKVSDKDVVNCLTHYKEDLIYFINHKKEISYFIDNIDKFKKLIDQDSDFSKTSDCPNSNEMAITCSSKESKHIIDLYQPSSGWLSDTLILQKYWKKKHGQERNFALKLRQLKNVLSKIERAYISVRDDGEPPSSVLSAITIESMGNLVNNSEWSATTKSSWLGIIIKIIDELSNEESSDKALLLLRIKNWQATLNSQRNRNDLKNISENNETLIALSRIFDIKVLEYWFEKFESDCLKDAEAILGLLFFIFFRNSVESMLEIKWDDFDNGCWDEIQDSYRFTVKLSQTIPWKNKCISKIFIPSNLHTLFAELKTKSKTECIFPFRSSLKISVQMRKWLNEFTGHTLMNIDKLRQISMDYLRKKEGECGDFENFTFVENENEIEVKMSSDKESNEGNHKKIDKSKTGVNPYKSLKNPEIISENQQTLISLSRIFNIKVLEYWFEKFESDCLKDVEVILGLLFFIFFRNSVESMLEVKWDDFDNGCWDEIQESYRFTVKFSTNSFSHKSGCNLHVFIPSNLHVLFSKLRTKSNSEYIFSVRSSLIMSVQMRKWLNEFTGYTLMNIDKLRQISMDYLRKKEGKCGDFENFTFVETIEVEDEKCSNEESCVGASDYSEKSPLKSVNKTYKIGLENQMNYVDHS